MILSEVKTDSVRKVSRNRIQFGWVWSGFFICL